eukprot:410201-Alexandrium_andersonii.AAC.1
MPGVGERSGAAAQPCGKAPPHGRCGSRTEYEHSEVIELAAKSSNGEGEFIGRDGYLVKRVGHIRPQEGDVVP